MTRTRTELAYVKAAVESSSPVTLVLLLFDTLIADLRNAIEAIRAGDIEKRSADVKHGFLVLQQLQESVDMEGGGEAATHFRNFYCAIHAKLLEGHMKASAEILQNQIDLLLDVRGAWQQVQTPDPAAAVSRQSGAGWTA